MELYFLRHGLAGQHGDPKYSDDSLRPLTEEGRKKLQRASGGMRALKLTYDAILSSPYVRARQTAEIVAETYGMKLKDIYVTTNLLPPASAKKLLKEIYETFPKAGSVLLVGHEPHLTDMIAELLQSPRALAIDFKKGGLCNLTIAASTGAPVATLNWLLTPGQLGLIKE